MCVQCPIWLFFCNSLISCFPGMLLRNCLCDFEMVSVTPVIAGITFAFTFRRRWNSIMRSLYFKIYSTSFLITFLYPGIETSINMHVPFFLLSRIMISGLLLVITIIILLLLLSSSHICTEMRECLSQYCDWATGWSTEE